MMLLVSAGLVGGAFCGTPITVSDQKGRSIEIVLDSVTEDSVTFSRSGDTKVFTLPMSHFAEASQFLIRKQAELLPVEIPKVEADLMIGNRRRKDGDSSYMMRQEITPVVKVSNTYTKKETPELHGKVVFIGQDRRTPDALGVLCVREFDVPVLKAAGTFATELAPFVTKYDSDNKGYNNVGGLEYFGYVLTLANKDGRIVYDLASAGTIRKALNEGRHLLEDIMGYKEGLVITDKLVPAPKGTVFRVPN